MSDGVFSTSNANKTLRTLGSQFRKWKLTRFIACGLLAFAGWSGLNTWRAWSNVTAVDFDLSAARALTATTNARPNSPSALLIVGLDARPNRRGVHADSIHLLSFDRPTKVTSVPRDLIATDPCTGRETTLAQLYEPCEVTAAERLGLAIEEALGRRIGGFAATDERRFRDLINTLGGVTICSDYPYRGGPAGEARIEAGCNRLDGRSALFWSEMRAPQILTEAGWRPATDAGDAARVIRIQGVMQELIRATSTLRPWSPELTKIAGAFTVSDLSLWEAIGIAWSIQSADSLQWETLATEPTITEGMYGLRLAEPVATP